MSRWTRRGRAEGKRAAAGSIPDIARRFSTKEITHEQAVEELRRGMREDCPPELPAEMRERVIDCIALRDPSEWWDFLVAFLSALTGGPVPAGKRRVVTRVGDLVLVYDPAEPGRGRA